MELLFNHIEIKELHHLKPGQSVRTLELRFYLFGQSLFQDNFSSNSHKLHVYLQIMNYETLGRKDGSEATKKLEQRTN